MATELLELHLEELSLVDRPANAEAMVTLFKRDDTQEEDITKMTEEQDAKIKASWLNQKQDSGPKASKQ